MSEGARHHRVLAIDPTTRGFGFVVFEGIDHLLDWGVVHVKRQDKHEQCLARVAVLMDRYEPSVVVVEDPSPGASRRIARVRHLITAVIELATRRRARTCCLTRRAIRKHFLEVGVDTKGPIAGAIATRFPELTPHLPPKRKMWMSEDDRMAIFDAASLALTYLSALEKRRRKMTLAA